MDIIRIGQTDKAEWNRLVLASRESRFYQMLEYREVLKEIFGYKSVYLVFAEGGETVGLLPLFLVKTLLFNKAVSIPFAEYGGIVSRSPEKLDFPLIKDYLRDLAAREGVDYIEINGGLGVPRGAMENHFRYTDFHHYAVLKLRGENELWNGFDRQIRKAVRSALRRKVEPFERADEAAIKEYFYPLYLRSSRRLSSPPLSLKYFLACRRHFGRRMKIFFAKNNSKVIAALLGYATDTGVYIQVVASDEREHVKRPVDLVHWEFIKWAVREGLEYFDFGPVRYEGQRRYKLKWGGELKGYRFFYCFKPGSKVKEPPRPLTPLSPGVGVLKRLWKLQPAPVQKRVGPWVRKELAK